MSRTYNTMPYEYQFEVLGRDYHECVSQRDLRVVSEVRRLLNKKYRAGIRSLMVNERYDDLPHFEATRGKARWRAW